MNREHIVISMTVLKDSMVDYGVLPSGVPLSVNQLGPRLTRWLRKVLLNRIFSPGSQEDVKACFRESAQPVRFMPITAPI